MADQERARRQAPGAVVMILPHHFYPNAQTAADNAFQQDADDDRRTVEKAAYDEVLAAAEALRGAGVTVHLFEDTGRTTPDSVFPNNWFSTHEDGRIVLYPMYATSRRDERRSDIIDALKAAYNVFSVVDYAPYESEDRFLEGTGAMVLDHLEKVAYVSLSHRADELLLARFCAEFSFEPLAFETRGPDGNPIYHTNVMMHVGSSLAMVGFDTIVDLDMRADIRSRLESSGRTVISLSNDQIAHFAGNALEAMTPTGPVLVLSATARTSLTPAQVKAIESLMPMLALDVPMVELAGGSARCMLAGIHLPIA